MKKVLFWRTTTNAENFEDAFDDAKVEFVEFESEDAFDAKEDIFEIPSRCICYNPECPDRRYKDKEGRIYARCLPEDVGGYVAEQIGYMDEKTKANALRDIEKYLYEVGFYTIKAEEILFNDAPTWWIERCAKYITHCFQE